MPDVREYQSVVEEAEQAAGAGDFARANTCLREALQIQESALGTSHPDLAFTLNNLAVVCESLGDMDEAEHYYRRSYAIASGSLPPDDPLVATSRDNLRDFCASSGRPLDDWPGLERPGPPVVPPPAVPPPAPGVVTTAVAPASRPARSPAAAAAVTPPAAPSRTGVVAVAAVLAIVGTLVAVRSWRATAPDDRATAVASTTAPAPAVETPDAVPPAAPVAPPASAVPAPPASAPAAAAPVSPPAATLPPAPPERTTGATAAAPPAIRIVTANVCASLSTSGAWRCDAIGEVTAPVRAAFYTRIASPSALRVQHRWYQGQTLRQSVTLSIAANPSAGYRTFSRQTLSPGTWRVELRAADGSVLHEAAFDVR